MPALACASCGSSTEERGIDGLLVADFEEDGHAAVGADAWYGFTDANDGGLSSLEGPSGTTPRVTMDGYRSARAMELSYSLDRGSMRYVGHVGLGVTLGSTENPRDFSAYDGLAYTYRGPGHRVRLLTSDGSDDSAHADDSKHYGTNLPESSSWRTAVVPFEALFREQWDDLDAAGLPFDPARVRGIEFVIYGSGSSGTFSVDDVVLAENSKPSKPDLRVREAEPPPDEELESVRVEHPLQAKAMRHLNRGFSIGGWLEQERFTSFRFDEDFVQKLAAAGFQSLRLPIDLDLYVERTEGTGDSLAVEISPDLFTVLDTFDAWTAKYGLSLTIDYHQYTTPLDVTDADSLATAAALWRAVAEHFADSPREDLFYELLNEPELSFGGKPPSQEEWTAIANGLIAAIRAVDPTRPIIFGDTPLYGADALSKREPLSDANVIYAFHTYRPFLFTHQGAEWAGMGGIHDIPYPYDPARWAQHSVELGFIPPVAPGLLDLANNYHRDGTRAAIRNGAVAAKRWGVEHGVPVICNELGANARSSRLDDRARYYADIVAIFDELEIPWQLWFGVMNEDGDVPTELRDALRLNE